MPGSILRPRSEVVKLFSGDGKLDEQQDNYFPNSTEDLYSRQFNKFLPQKVDSRLK